MSDDLRKKIIGLGESSFKKSYFPELQKRNKEFELFKRIFEITNDIIAIISIRNLEFKAVNKAFCNFFNIDESNFQSHKPIDVFGKDYFKLIMDQNVKQSKYLHELHIHEKVFFVEAEVSIIEQEGENFLINIIRDRTEHLTAQKNLEDLNNKIIEQNLELQNRNKQIASINKDLIKAKEKAEESDRLKTAFLQNMSHEIRTPMNGIFGFAELIKEPGILKEDIAKFADTIFSAAKQLLSVVDNIINISTITTGQEKVNYTMVDLDSFFSDLVLLFKNIAEEKGITIMEPDYIPLKPLWTDEVKLKQIFINLIGNAIKYSDHGQIILDIEEKV